MRPFPHLLLVLPVTLLMACSAATPEAVVSAQAETEIAMYPVNLQAVGVEPFWGVKVEGEALAYTTPETMGAPRMLRATRAIDADGVHLSGEDGGMPFRLDLRHGPCSDGMSDREYPFSALLLLDGKTSKGCAFDPALPPPPQ